MIRYEFASDEEKEVYYYLGTLATRFAVMEATTQEITYRLITPSFVIGMMISEKNSFDINIQTLKKLSGHIDFEKAVIGKLCEKLYKVKEQRNLFIHGLWLTPFKLDGEIWVRVLRNKLKIEELEDRVQSSSVIPHDISLNDMLLLSEQVEEIVSIQEALLKKIENEYNYSDIHF